ncbi:hypothetical protein [Polaromonas sp.]|uniref:hypothetical protein n=1 Tax=Polaromonas sp. TaxID=1869339 RepID=UPI00286D6642|nr:hypothetical protein [Polaromonas sp.]
MMSTVSYLGGWLGATGLAVAFALASPTDSSVMGHLPAFMSQTLMRQPLAVPDGLPSDRTLALITFKRGQRDQADSWIRGLNLQNDASIAWVRMPVIKDPGTLTGRSAVEDKLLRHYPTDTERANLVPVFTDRANFARSAGLNSTEQVYAVVINRQGEVLARMGGQYDPDKARTLRETLLAQSF